MTDRGIIFSAPMIKALLDGRKTQTRRLAWRLTTHQGRYCEAPTVWQKAQPGDRLYARETWADVNTENGPALLYRADQHYHFCVNDAYPVEYDRYPKCQFSMWCGDLLRGEPDHAWRPSIHMPRWASRLTLVVTEARRQRLQEISEGDALAEGIYRQNPSPEEIAAGDCTEDDFVFLAPGTRQGYGPRPEDPQWGPTAALAYRCLWDSLHGAGAWARNEEVVAIAFTVHLANIDRLGEEAA